MKKKATTTVGLIALCTAGAYAQNSTFEWLENAKLLPADGVEGDWFGFSVFISGDTAVVGAMWDDDNGTDSGAVYVFTRSGGVWTQQAKLLSADGTSNDGFGRSVSVSGDTAVIGAWGDADNGTASGSAYVFVRSNGVWTQQAKLLPADGAGGDWFGESVSISGDTAIIGARRDTDNGSNSGSAYVFVRSGDVWTQQAKLLPTDGADGDWFGFSVSISGDTALIGAFSDDNENGINSGSTYVFTRSGGVWTQQVKLLPTDGAGEDWFGWSVSVSGDTAVIGAHQDGDNGIHSGSAYVFTHTGGVWTQQAKLLPSDGAAEDGFGWSVSINGDTAVVGAKEDDDNGPVSGSAYIFTRSSDTWTQQAKLLPADGAADDEFGRSVSISGDTAVIGAWGDDDNGSKSGSAYIFSLTTINCNLADIAEPYGVLDLADVTTFIGSFILQNDAADIAEPFGLFDLADIVMFVTLFNAGCP